MPRPTRTPDSGRLADDERAVSVAVNHVLAIGITTILITGLIFAAGNVLDGQRGAATDRELRTIGNRIANQVETAEATAMKSGGVVVVKTSHPDRITGSLYTVSLSTDCDLGSACLKLSPTADDKVVEVAVRNETPVDTSRVADGTFWIKVGPDGIELLSRAPGDLGDGFAPQTGARVASSADYTGPYDEGGAVGGGGGAVIGIPPSIDYYSVSNVSGSKIEVSWNVSDGDGNLSWVNITVTPSGGTDPEAQENFSVSGGLSNQTVIINGVPQGQNFDVEIEAKDGVNNTETETEPVTT